MDANENDKENCGIRDKQIEPEHLFVSLDDIVNRELWRMFPAIDCNKVEDIPIDYPGPIGVPITYMGKHNPARFEILDCVRPKLKSGKVLYRRILIRNLHPKLPETVDLVEWFDRMGEKIEVLVEEIPRKLRADYIYKVGVVYGNIVENEKPIKFYFETREEGE